MRGIIVIAIGLTLMGCYPIRPVDPNAAAVYSYNANLINQRRNARMQRVTPAPQLQPMRSCDLIGNTFTCY